MFAYCGSNPVSNSDPTGKFFFTLIGGMIGGIVGAVDAWATGGDATEGFENGFVSGAISGAGLIGATMNIISLGLAPINGEIIKRTVKEVIQQIWNIGVLNEASNFVEGTMVAVFTTLSNKACINVKN